MFFFIIVCIWLKRDAGRAISNQSTLLAHSLPNFSLNCIRVCVLPGFAWGAGAGRAASGAALGVESDDSSGMYNVTVKLWLCVQLSKQP